MMTIIYTIIATCLVAVASVAILRRKSTVSVPTPIKSTLNPSVPPFVPSTLFFSAEARDEAEIKEQMAEFDDMIEEQLFFDAIDCEEEDDDFEEEDEEEVDWIEIDVGNGKMLRVPREAAVHFNANTSPKSHPTLPPVKKSSIPCYFFKKGRCNKGDACKYSHLPNSK